MVLGQTDKGHGLRKAHLKRVLPWIFFTIAAMVGATLALLLVLGVNVMVNALLAVGAACAHGVAAVLVITIVVELWTALVKDKWSDLGPVAVLLLVVGAVGACTLCVLINRYVAHVGLSDRQLQVVRGTELAAVAIAAVVMFHVLRPGTRWLQGPAVCAVLTVFGLIVGATFIGGWAATSAWYRNRDVADGPDLAQLPPIEGVVGTYVALGDSYSAGEGLRPFHAFTSSNPRRGGTGCHRSSQAFPGLLRFAGAQPAERFVACSGAVTFELLNPRHVGELVVAAQVDAGVHAEVDLVTVTIGGNDVVFSKVVAHCFLRTDCLDRTFTSPADDPARGLSFPESQPLRAWAYDALEIVRDKVTPLFRELRRRYPEARIIVVGYPYLFPDRGAPLLDLSDCQAILRRFSRGERVEVRALQDRLNEVLHRTAVDADVEFVSPAAGWDGHEPCGGADQYTNSIKPFVQFESVEDLVDGGTLHPNAAGQRELARLVTCYLAANPSAPVGDVDLPAPGSLANPVEQCGVGR